MIKNKILLLFLYVWILIPCIFSQGDIEIPKVNAKARILEQWSNSPQYYLGLEMYLPYEKPEGIIRIYNPYYHERSVVIDSLIIDGKIVRSKRGGVWFETDEVSTVPISAERQNQEHLLIWEYVYWSKKKYITSSHWPHHEGTIRDFRIPVGSKEAYMTYRIVFPNKEEVGPYTIHWEMDWPEDFGWN